MAELTQARLKELLSYDADTGIFTWIKDNRRAGGVNGRGYLLVRINTKLYPAHRLAWLYMTGSFPAGLLDHRDTDRLNNRWVNLRECTASQNQWNRSKKASSLTGVKGVTYRANRGTYIVNVNKKYHGSFKDLDSATTCAMRVREELHGEFANHG